MGELSLEVAIPISEAQSNGPLRGARTEAGYNDGIDGIISLSLYNDVVIRFGMELLRK